MAFPPFHIEEIKRQEQRNLTRFDLDLDLPDHLLPYSSTPIFLTMHPDLGDASKGKLVTIVIGSTRHCLGEHAAPARIAAYIEDGGRLH